jgi:hypothetical protein
VTGYRDHTCPRCACLLTPRAERSRCVRPLAGSRLCLKRACLIHYLASGSQICHKGSHLPQNGSPRVYLWALPSTPAYKGQTRDEAQSLSFRHSYAAPPNMSETKGKPVSSQPKVRIALSPRDPEPSGCITACLFFFKASGSDESRRRQKCTETPNRTGRKA